ncbi:MAG: hypothetical protein UU73_C0004G0010 [Candidatus Daviesbacteria bacterium GW2011_GWA1_41_61]|uniref:Uncharacterized protein n=1 Tax=Candidatus Daviesbacteria bacterium GW2011_GWA2_40_9 TaxID=1618424 RepID=A0A0G0WGD8_9BACT|nr:MAG: hypothetical protein UU26_C0011G0026 [Candidatus Daviesbacteria bacterium GW2011_GWC1_40_9]KKR83355.1 MAG: hypothetical protein UU29_C0006G0044 [Candidatus Daviesbacteria bacterium GW2011_GWA2_40_9]KKR93214.1 MAG: hypothetical protein UU44_C0003G0010 [Candidatus Daviesbacteria bacterium GW2011_GWB1_41_15]KKS14702.1 MAG: hypothetical protein UU73_C0004G0010 [Candidatus Daviesbacteria bacterium GW2011_GWA1_41_61]
MIPIGQAIEGVVEAYHQMVAGRFISGAMEWECAFANIKDSPSDAKLEALLDLSVARLVKAFYEKHRNKKKGGAS